MDHFANLCTARVIFFLSKSLAKMRSKYFNEGKIKVKLKIITNKKYSSRSKNNFSEEKKLNSLSKKNSFVVVNKGKVIPRIKKTIDSEIIIQNKATLKFKWIRPFDI